MPVRKLPPSNDLFSPIKFNTTIAMILIPVGLCFMAFSCMTMTNETQNWPLPLLILSGLFIVWGYAALKQVHKLKSIPQLITYTLNYEPYHKAGKYIVTIVLQIPPDAKPEDQKNYAANIHLRDRFSADIEVAINKSFESLTPAMLPNVTTSWIELAIDPAVAYIQDSLSIPIVKYDCSSVKPKPEPPNPPQPPPDEFGIKIGDEY
jgi:hypothetical protein